MKAISKRIFVFLIVGLLSFCSVEMTYYKSVHAFEWVTAGISTVEALKWLLGAMGIIATVGSAQENFWDGYEEEFYEYASDENIAGPDVRAWLEKLAKGTLDKGSEVWNCFKSWCAQLVTDNSSGSSDLSYPATISDLNNYLVANYPTIFKSYSFNQVYFPDSLVYGFVYSQPTQPNGVFYYVLTDGADFGIDSLGRGYIRDGYYTGVNNVDASYTNGSFNSSSYVTLNMNDQCVVSSNGNIVNNSHNVVIVPYGASTSVGTLDTINDARQEQFDLINRNTANEVEQEVAIPMPGVSSGDDTISQDAYDNIIERVNNGDISVDDAVEEIQQVLQVIVYDTATDDVIPITPDPDDPTQNEDKDDVINNAKSNMGFTLAGLENVFPFCIPWDIYAFLNLLDADPVAPVFNIPFPNINDPTHPLTTEVDLSSWDDAMRIIRLAQDFLFIIGLAFLTRNLIGAGGGD